MFSTRSKIFIDSRIVHLKKWSDSVYGGAIRARTKVAIDVAVVESGYTSVRDPSRVPAEIEVVMDEAIDEVAFRSFSYFHGASFMLTVIGVILAIKVLLAVARRIIAEICMVARIDESW